MEIFLGWLIFSFIVGAIGSNRKIGFLGAFLFSLLLSPIIGLIVALTSKDKKTEQYEAQILALQQQQAHLLQNMQRPASDISRTEQEFVPPAIGNMILPVDANARAARLKDLHARSMITEQEYLEQLSKL